MPLDHATLADVVVVADADAEIRCIVADALSHLGTTIVQAANVYEVFEEAARAVVHLVVTEVEMPGASADYISELRRRLPYSSIVVITRDSACETHAMQHGASGFLKKPFRTRQLRAIVATVLGKAHRSCGVAPSEAQNATTSFRPDCRITE
jgi:DNA-binding NtrC family response regulator